MKKANNKCIRKRSGTSSTMPQLIQLVKTNIAHKSTCIRQTNKNGWSVVPSICGVHFFDSFPSHASFGRSGSKFLGGFEGSLDGSGSIRSCHGIQVSRLADTKGRRGKCIDTGSSGSQDSERKGKLHDGNTSIFVSQKLGFGVNGFEGCSKVNYEDLCSCFGWCGWKVDGSQKKVFAREVRRGKSLDLDRHEDNSNLNGDDHEQLACSSQRTNIRACYVDFAQIKADSMDTFLSCFLSRGGYRCMREIRKCSGSTYLVLNDVYLGMLFGATSVPKFMGLSQKGEGARPKCVSGHAVPAPHT